MSGRSTPSPTTTRRGCAPAATRASRSGRCRATASSRGPTARGCTAANLATNLTDTRIGAPGQHATFERRRLAHRQRHPPAHQRRRRTGPGPSLWPAAARPPAGLDKEQIWADNAASSPFFGNAYVCYTDFHSLSGGRGVPAVPLHRHLDRWRRQLDQPQWWPRRWPTSSQGNRAGLHGAHRQPRRGVCVLHPLPGRDPRQRDAHHDEVLRRRQDLDPARRDHVDERRLLLSSIR